MRISDWSSDVCSSDLPNPFVLMLSKLRPFFQRQRRRTALRQAQGKRLDLSLAHLDRRDRAVSAIGYWLHDEFAAALIGAGTGLPFPAVIGDIPAAVGGIVQEGVVPRPLEARVALDDLAAIGPGARSEEHTSELQSIMRIEYAVLCL